ncbi:DUF4339 domain-containing protein [Neisseria polysaccharea]|uniref:DUF4339 domain-containing protein n=1 Tax=Neisseria TaxID=482 RepID=UPI0027DEAFE6|nr:DUF4339 domain-containing protein [Neisseria subflava]
MDNSEQKWFYENKKQRHGPVSLDEMKNLISTGVISYGNVVWTNGYPDWVKIENSELKIFLSEAAPPPLKGESVSNVMVWMIAFLPLAGEFIRGMILGSMYSNVYDLNQAIINGELWYVTLVLNIVFCIADGLMLKKAAIDVKRFIAWAFFLMPVYLYKRARYLNQSLAYFWVWIVCFIIAIVW